MRKRKTLKKDEIIYGYQPVLEAIKSGREIEKLLLMKTLHPSKVQELKKEATAHGLTFQFVPREKLNKFTRQNHQGIVALISPIAYVDLSQLLPMLFESGKSPFLLLLDKITDVRNMGSIARSAECAGVDALILPAKGSALITSDAIKTSAGALTRLPVCRVSSLKWAVDYIKNSGINVVGTKENAKLVYHQADFTIPVAIVMGSEEKGVSADVLDLCDHTIGIPIMGEIESLNVSVATGIVLYEAVKQRQQQTH